MKLKHWATIGLLAAAATPALAAPATFSSRGTPDAWLAAQTTDWMSRLPDSMELAGLSIPGTHDSAARFGGLAFQTQSWTIDEQLEAGIRYLDLRTRRTTSPGTRALAIHHDIVFEKLWLSDVLDTLVAFLKAHPRETIIVRLRGDEIAPMKGALSYAEIWPAYLAAYGDFRFDGDDERPTLGELRGRIYVLDNGAGLSHHGAEWQNASTSVQDDYYVWALGFHWLSGHMASLASKKDIVNRTLDLAGAPGEHPWYFNHLSGSGAMAPRDVARATNRSAYRHIGGAGGARPLGTVILDFPGEDLVARIVRSNFSDGR